MLMEHLVTVGEQMLNCARGAERPEAILFLHGVSRCWQTFLPLLTPLSARYEIFALDHRGHGRSGRASSYDVIDYAQDASAFVRDVIGRPTHIYGHSLGAMAAVGVAADVPHLVRGIILEDPPFSAMGERIAVGPLRSMFAAMQKYAGDARAVRDVARDFGDEEVINPRTGHSVRMKDIRDPVSLRFSARSLRDVDPRVFSSILSGDWLRDFPVDLLCSKIQTPVLLLQADESAGGMLNDADAEILKRLGGDVLHIRMPAIPHLMHWAATDRILTLVRGFLESLRE